MVVAEPAVVDGRDSWDPNGDPLTHAWTVVSVPTDSAITSASLSGANKDLALFTPDVAGDYRLLLTVSDGSASDSELITTQVWAALRNSLPSTAFSPNRQSSTKSTTRTCSVSHREPQSSWWPS